MCYFLQQLPPVLKTAWDTWKGLGFFAGSMTEGKRDGRVEGVCRGKGVMGGYECKLRKEGGEAFGGCEL